MHNLHVHVDDIELFESIALAQTPATQKWTPVTPYDFESRKAIEGQHPALLVEVFAPTVVVDAGCGPDGILVKLLREAGVPSALGFDVQIPKQSIDPALTHGSLTDPCFMDGDEDPWADLVICREVLEHLTLVEIQVAIRNLCRLSKQYVYVTTRFSSEHDLLRVDTHDDLDPTHITLAAKDLLRLMFVLQGFKRRADLEDAIDWQNKQRVLVYERVR